MKTLYVSDLDGTLLRNDAMISDYTARTINELAAQGMLFSYATARSYVTARQATAGLEAQIPLIVNNGAFIVDNATAGKLQINLFDDDVEDLIDDLVDHGISPVVFALIGGEERFSYVPGLCRECVWKFLNPKQGDPRKCPVEDVRKLHDGKKYCVTCIDDEEKLRPLFEKHRASFPSVFYREQYTGEQWLEYMPRSATKARAALQLKQMLGADRIVAFGDNMNDIDLFSIADECYAVANAAEELKKIATGVIGSNDEDAVAKWLMKNALT